MVWTSVADIRRRHPNAQAFQCPSWNVLELPGFLKGSFPTFLSFWRSFIIFQQDFRHHQSWIDFFLERGHDMAILVLKMPFLGFELFDGLALGLPPIFFATRKAWNLEFQEILDGFRIILYLSILHIHWKPGRHGDDGSSALNFQAVIGACQNDQQHKVLCHLFPQLRRLCLGRWLRTDSERVVFKKGQKQFGDAKGFEAEQATWRVTVPTEMARVVYFGPKAQTCSKNVHTGKFSSVQSRVVFHFHKVLPSVLKDAWAQHFLLVSQVLEWKTSKQHKTSFSC